MNCELVLEFIKLLLSVVYCYIIKACFIECIDEFLTYSLQYYGTVNSSRIRVYGMEVGFDVGLFQPSSMFDRVWEALNQREEGGLGEKSATVA